MRSTLLLTSLFGSLVVFAAPLKESKPGLLARANVKPAAAEKTATARVHGKIVSEELEEEHALLVYSFDIRVPKHAGIEEVQVNAMTGAIVSVEHEDAAAEAKEAKAEAKKSP